VSHSSLSISNTMLPSSARSYPYGCSTCGSGFSSCYKLAAHIRYNRSHLAANSTHPFFARAINTTTPDCLPANTEHQVEWPLFESEDSEFNTVPKESDDVATSNTIESGFGRNVDSTSSFRKPDYSMLERYAAYVNNVCCC
jgi:hypothetical protein